MTKFVVGGRGIALTHEKVLTAMVGVEPEQIRTHVVQVDGVDYPPKQVFAVITGWARQSYTTMEAQRVLTKLGFVSRKVTHDPLVDLYPEHAKLKAIPEEARDAVGDFVVWLDEHDFNIVGRYTGDEQQMRPQSWIARFYDLDEDAINAEKDSMLAQIRHQNDRADLVKVRERLKGRSDGDG